MNYDQYGSDHEELSTIPIRRRADSGERRPLYNEPRRVRRDPGQYAKLNKKHKKKKRKWKWVLVVVLALIVAALISIVVIAKNKMSKINYTELDDVVTFEKSEGYTTIVLFGLDSREGEIKQDVNSDTIMIAGIDNMTHDVRLASIYRDTLLQTREWEYGKANFAYCEGGPTESINMLNRCMDLDIEKFVTVDFNALVDVIDCLGGLDISMTKEEVFWLNGYLLETAEVIGKACPETLEETSGVKHCNGIQAVSYCRIRYTDGDDYKRTERQRKVLEMIFEKAKSADLSQLNEIIDKVFPKIYTNFTSKELLSLATEITTFSLVDKSGFPNEKLPWIGASGNDFIVATDFKQEVIDLHKFLYPNLAESYTPPQLIEDLSNEMAYMLTLDYGVDNSQYLDEGDDEDYEDYDDSYDENDSSEWDE